MKPVTDGPAVPPVAPWLLLLEGACVGGLAALVLTERNVFDILLDDRISGVSAPAIHRFLATDYRAEVVHAILEMVALSLLIGVAVGVGAAAVWWCCARSDGKRGIRRWRRILGLSALCLLGFLWMYLYDVAARPALHQPELFERGGIRAALQIAVSDWIGRFGVLAIGLWLLASYVTFPWHWHTSVRARLRRFGLSAFIAAGVAALALQSCHWGGPSKARTTSLPRPNVLIIASDSLRPDHLDSVRAPNVAKLMDQAVVFERAYTPLARTFPAWVSIMTGQYPHHHGIRHMFPRFETRQRELPTLARRFGQQGYRTAVVGDFAADIFRRIDLGFSEIATPTFTMRELVREHLLKHNPWLLAWLRGSFMRWLVPTVVEMHEATDPEAVTRDALDAIDKAGDEPFFVTVFYSTTHFPYAVPGPDHARFRKPGYAGPYRYAKADTLNPLERLGPADIEQIRALYDGAVHRTDAAIGDLLDGLVRRGADTRTVIVVTADHGEELYEHGRSQGHGDHLRSDEALRVPLVLAAPTRRTPRRIAEPVSLVDLAPTLLDLTQLEPLGSADGRSLVPAMDGRPLPPWPVYSETGLWFTEVIPEVPLSDRLLYPDLTQLTEVDRLHGDQIVIRERWEPTAIAAKHRLLQIGDLRLLYLPTRAGARFELCDLKVDPGCTRDSSAEHPRELSDLESRFWQFVANDRAVLRFGDWLMPREKRETTGARP